LLREATIGLVRIPDRLFAGCAALMSITLTAHVSVIGGSAFRSCSSLQRIDLSSLSREMEVGSRAFALSGLVEVNFPANLRRIGDEAFSGCASLVSVRLPRELGALGVKVFVD
jgi:DMSO reductase anchor subunit